jgi:hypothetical protein
LKLKKRRERERRGKNLVDVNDETMWFGISSKNEDEKCR